MWKILNISQYGKIYTQFANSTSVFTADPGLGSLGGSPAFFLFILKAFWETVISNFQSRVGKEKNHLNHEMSILFSNSVGMGLGFSKY
jgi:hypothetical protein